MIAKELLDARRVSNFVVEYVEALLRTPYLTFGTEQKELVSHQDSYVIGDVGKRLTDTGSGFRWA
jgi:hypothetical protein